MNDIRLRPLAEADFVERTEYCRSQGGDVLGKRFFDAAIEALRDIERESVTGSPPIDEMFGIDGAVPSRLARRACDAFCLVGILRQARRRSG